MRAFLVFVVLLFACGRLTPAPTEGEAPRTTGPSRLVAAIMSDPKDIGPEAGPASGVDALRGLMHAGLASLDERDVLRAQLAEAVPTLENGLWVLLPDGRM